MLYCTDTGGAEVDIGEFKCLTVDGKTFLAQCDMSLNVPIWRKVSDGCPSSDLRPGRLSPLPASLPRVGTPLSQG